MSRSSIASNFWAFAYLVVFSFTMATAQTNCGPTAYIPSNTSTVWDWRVSDAVNPSLWEAWVANPASGSGGNPVTLPNPFYFPQNAQPNSNISHFWNLTSIGAPLDEMEADFQPNGGWQVVFKNFGTTSALVDNPSFVLYNQFRGIMRVFVYIFPTQLDYNQAMLQTGYRPDVSTRRGLLFNFSSGLAFANDTLLNKTATDWWIVSSNEHYTNNLGYWAMQEIPISYDPCICQNTGSDYVSLAHRILVSQNANIELSGSIIGTMNQIVQSNNNSPSMTTFEYINHLFELGGEANKAGTKRQKDTQGILDGVRQYMAIDSLTFRDSLNHFTLLPEIVTKKNYKLPEWTSSIPYIGFAVGAMNQLLSGGDNASSSTTTTSFSMESTVKLTGSLQLSTPYPVLTYTSPGQSGVTPSVGSEPIYNNPLGIINLLNQPILEYYDYQASSHIADPQYSTLHDMAGTPGHICHTCTKINPVLRHYSLSEIPHVAINPGAGLELVSLQTRIVYTVGDNAGNIPINARLSNHQPPALFPSGALALPSPAVGNLPNPDPNTLNPNLRGAYYGPVMLGNPSTDLNYFERLARSGIFFENFPESQTSAADMSDVIYATPYAGLECSRDLTVLLAEYPLNYAPNSIYYQKMNYTPKFYLKLLVRLRRTDPYALQNNVEDILMVLKYPCGIRAGIDTLYDDLRYDWNWVQPYDYQNGDWYDYFTNDGLGPNSHQHYYPSIPFGNPPNQTIPFVLPAAGYPLNITLSNVVLPSDTTIFAWNSITIGDNVTSATSNTNIQLLAGNNISTSTNFFTQFPNATMRLTEYPPGQFGCAIDNDPNIFINNQQAIVQHCTGSRYLAQTQPSKHFVEGETRDSSSSASFGFEANLSLYPNPTGDFFTLEANGLPVGADVIIKMLDVQGRVAAQLAPEGFVVPANGAVSLRSNTTSLPSGLYLVVIEANGQAVATCRLVVAR